MPCVGEEPRWIAFKYERLDDYCTLCGLIGHKKGVCPAPQNVFPLDKYDKPLQASSYVSPRLVAKVQQKDSDSRISSTAFVGNSPSSVVPSQLLDSHGSNHGQFVLLQGSNHSQLFPLVNQMDLPISHSNVFNVQHVEMPNSIVPSQPN